MLTQPSYAPYLVLLPGVSQRCVKNHGNFVGGNLEQMGPMECLVPSSLKQSRSITTPHTSFNLNSTGCCLTINTERHPTGFS